MTERGREAATQTQASTGRWRESEPETERLTENLAGWMGRVTMKKISGGRKKGRKTISDLLCTLGMQTLSPPLSSLVLSFDTRKGTNKRNDYLHGGGLYILELYLLWGDPALGFIACSPGG